ncbi:DUF2905 domain-containing protein [Candidatus Woesearchaeota archaeon]|nr:DUF2905 domain-containing protein [Candidatus Woesearchaeota archaeon]
MKIGLILMLMGSVLFIAGLVLFYLPRLPGDIIIEKENMTVYIPLATSILISILLSAAVLLYQYFK